MQFIENSRPGVCRRIMNRFRLSEDDAKDIYQESAIALYNNVDKGIDVSLEKFFSGIWYRQTLKFLRDRKSTESYDVGDPASGTGVSMRKVNEIINSMSSGRGNQQSAGKNLLSPIMQPDVTFDLQQMKERVGKALDAMAQRCRQLLTMYYLEGYNWAELALQLDLKNADTAKSAANRCRRRFKEKHKELEIYVKG